MCVKSNSRASLGFQKRRPESFLPLPRVRRALSDRVKRTIFGMANASTCVLVHWHYSTMALTTKLLLNAWLL